MDSVGDVARDMLRMFPRPPFNTHSVEDMVRLILTLGRAIS